MDSSSENIGDTVITRTAEQLKTHENTESKVLSSEQDLETVDRAFTSNEASKDNLSKSLTLEEKSVTAEDDFKPILPNSADHDHERKVEKDQKTLSDHVSEGIIESHISSSNHESTQSDSPVMVTTETSLDTADDDGDTRLCIVHPSTPIRNSDSALRILRKFLNRVSKHFPIAYGGTKGRSFINLLFGTSNLDCNGCYTVYKHLVDVIIGDLDEDEDVNASQRVLSEENDIVIESILGHTGDTMVKARLAIAAFCHLIDTWCLETQRIHILQSGENISIFEALMVKSSFHSFSNVRKEALESQISPINSEIITAGLSCAESLVAHGCFDGVVFRVEKHSITSLFSSDTLEEEKDDGILASSVLCDSIFRIHFDTDEEELAGIKFLLTIGCRSVTYADGTSEAMLRGAHLLQAIRVCYRIYLSTESAPNKTTAKAALRQIVTGAFKRLESQAVNSIPNGESHKSNSQDRTEDGGMSPCDKSYHEKFPSYEHKDAYLVLRSLCKLSMKPLSADLEPHQVIITHNDSSRTSEDPELVGDRKMTKEKILIDPALDSKVLALDLILEILQRAPSEILSNPGPQLIYAVRHYLCHSLLSNCTCDNNYVVNLSLRLFVPLIRHFRAHLKTEIEAFVTNVFFVILDSKFSAIEHKLRVVVLFEEICSDPKTLAEIFLNYDCDLSAVDLFQRIVNTLAKIANIGLHDQGMEYSGFFVGGSAVARAEKMRQDLRTLRLEAMRALHKVLSSLESSIDSPSKCDEDIPADDATTSSSLSHLSSTRDAFLHATSTSEDFSASSNQGVIDKKSLVQIYDSKKKRREDFVKVTLKYNQKPAAGIKLAGEYGILNPDDPEDVARFLITNKDLLDKTQTGEYLGREPSYQDGFALKVLHAYASQLDFSGLRFDDGIKHYLSGFRLPGEAQKIDRIMEKFAERFTTQNPNVFPTADAAFILAFSVIMLNTDLHNPAIKAERRMTKEGFIRNNKGICDGESLPDEFLNDIFDRIKAFPISLKEDDEARAKNTKDKTKIPKSTDNGLFYNYDHMDKIRESDYKKERDEILRNTEYILRLKKKNIFSSLYHEGEFVSTSESGLKNEYVIPMFDVAWGPSLAVYSTVLESANGTMGSLLSIASDREIEAAAENAASATEICLSGFRLAIRIAGLCGNNTARSAFMHALSNFSLLGTGRLIEHRHMRCVETLLDLGRYDGELLGSSWEYVFKTLSEVSRLNMLFEMTTKHSRVQSALKVQKRPDSIIRRNHEAEFAEYVSDRDHYFMDDDSGNSLGSLSEEILEGYHDFDNDLDNRIIDELNARAIHDSIPSDLPDIIFTHSSTLSKGAIKDFIFQLCRVSRMEISGYGGNVGNSANEVDLTAVHYRQHHSLIKLNGEVGRYNQPDVYCLQKIVEVTHYNMDTRPRLVFSEIWGIVSAHLTSTALHMNNAVAMYAIDAFRQLCMQFLKREELGVFEFQRKFIKPFEAVMMKCKSSQIKEYLLRSVEQIIIVHGNNYSTGSIERENEIPHYSGQLKSGWRPLLAIIGQASCDSEDSVANLGFAILLKQLEQLSIVNAKNYTENSALSSKSSYVRADMFVDLIHALLMYVSCPRERISEVSIDQLVILCSYLANNQIPLPSIVIASKPTANEQLELWWPILMGLSKAIGDHRANVRIKALTSLFDIVSKHFFVPQSDVGFVRGDSQTLRLIFRGIIAPTLEYATANDSFSTEKMPLPDGFIRFIKRDVIARELESNKFILSGRTWIDTSFDHLMDSAISIALKSVKFYEDDSFIEEILSMFNTCFISDSASLAIHGVNRLYQFLLRDLSLDMVSESFWASVSHMLRKCMAVNGLPFNPNSNDLTSVRLSDDDVKNFLQEEQIFFQKRYISSHVVYVIGSIIYDENFIKSMGFKWYSFLLQGLGTGILAWDQAAEIVYVNPGSLAGEESTPHPPHYAENALYARKWMVKLLLQLISEGDRIFADSSSSNDQIRALFKKEFDTILNSYLEKESKSSHKNKTREQNLEVHEITFLVRSLIDGLSALDSDRLASISSLTPTLSACIQINESSVRSSVHKLLQRIFDLSEGKDKTSS